jgi:hypothetical protein
MFLVSSNFFIRNYKGSVLSFSEVIRVLAHKIFVVLFVKMSYNVFVVR